MAKQVTGYLKLQVKGGAANPAPPIGPALGSKGLNIMDFCKQFNARTQDKPGQVLPVLITIYNDKSFDFVIKTPPAAILILDAAKKQKGSAEPKTVKVGSITWDQVKTIAETKMPDLNAFRVEAAMKMMKGGDVNAMTGNSFVVKIKNQNMAMVMSGGMINMETLYLHEKNTSYKIDRSAKTYSPMPVSQNEDPNNKVEVKVTKTGETAKVLDYTCTKYIVDITSKGQTMQQVVWSTTAIKDFDLKSLAKQRTGNNQYSLFYEQIEGVPLKTEMSAPQGKMSMEATEIKRQSLPASDFVIPSGYKEVPFSVF